MLFLPGVPPSPGGGPRSGGAHGPQVGKMRSTLWRHTHPFSLSLSSPGLTLGVPPSSSPQGCPRCPQSLPLWAPLPASTHPSSYLSLYVPASSVRVSAAERVMDPRIRSVPLGSLNSSKEQRHSTQLCAYDSVHVYNSREHLLDKIAACYAKESLASRHRIVRRERLSEKGFRFRTC